MGSGGLAACAYKGPVLWSRSWDMVSLLAYQSGTFFGMIVMNIVAALKVPDSRLGFPWSGVITACIFFTCRGLVLAAGGIAQHVKGRRAIAPAADRVIQGVTGDTAKTHPEPGLFFHSTVPVPVDQKENLEVEKKGSGELMEKGGALNEAMSDGN